MNGVKNNKKINNSKPEKHYDWIVQPDCFFALALLGCDSMLDSESINGELIGNSVFKKLGLSSSHPNYELIYSVVYNFKHGVELHIKGLGNMDHGEYVNKHDLKSLFEFAENSAGKNMQIIKKLYGKAWGVLDKYYYGTYITSNTSQKHPDIKNEAERYPENNNAYQLYEPYKWVNVDIVRKLKSDIKNTEKYFFDAMCDIEPAKTYKYNYN